MLWAEAQDGAKALGSRGGIAAQQSAGVVQILIGI